MDADQFTHTLRRGRARVRCGLDRADVAAHHDGHKPAADGNLAGKHHICRFDHGVRRLNGGDKPLCFYHTQCVHGHLLFSGSCRLVYSIGRSATASTAAAKASQADLQAD